MRCRSSSKASSTRSDQKGSARLVQSKQNKTDRGSQEPTGSATPSNRTVVLLLAGATAFAVLAVAVLAILNTTGSGDAVSFTPSNRGLLPVGSQAPSFTAEEIRSGEEVSGGGGSEAGEARATMLVFFATWCPHCNKEAPIISALESEYKDLRVIMIGIDGRDDSQKVREFVEEYDIESPAVYQPSLGETYRASGYPTTYVLNENNEIVAAHSGEAPKSVYEGWIEDALG
jgi:thiol-disulfide isomerase/thioredoxin